MSAGQKVQDDIRNLANRLSQIESMAQRNRNAVGSTETKLSALDASMTALTTELRAFTSSVTHLSVLTEARNRVHVLEGMMEKKFGRYDGARRGAARLLYSLGDVSWPSLRAETTPDLQPLADEYWLAAAGLAFAAWAGDDRREAERWTAASLTADALSASLYYSLVARRFGRDSAAVDWLRRYFASLNPLAMDPDAKQVFFAVCDGAFGTETLDALVAASKRWIAGEEALENTDDSRETWTQLLLSKKSLPQDDDFTLLRQHCLNWPSAQEGLDWAATQQGLAGFYQSVHAAGCAGAVGGEQERTVFSPDAILRELGGRYARDETPYRRDCRMAWLCVEENGDVEAAESRLRVEWKDGENGVPFSSFLAEIIHGGTVFPERTRRLAVFLASPRLEAAYERLAAGSAARIPDRFMLKIGNWTGQTTNGSNESELLASLSGHLDEEARKVRPLSIIDEKLLFPAAVLLILSIITVSTIIVPLAAFAGFAFYFLNRMKTFEAEKEARKIADDAARKQAMATLSAILLEVRSYRKLLVDRNREMEEARKVFTGMEYECGSGLPAATDDSTARTVASLPSWDLLPPSADAEKSVLAL